MVAVRRKTGALTHHHQGGKHAPQKEASKTGEAPGGAAIPADRPPSGTQDTPCWTESDTKSASRSTPHGTRGKARWAKGRPSNKNRRTPCCQRAGND